MNKLNEYFKDTPEILSLIISYDTSDWWKDWTDKSWGIALKTCRLWKEYLQASENQEDAKTAIENQKTAVISNWDIEAATTFPPSQTCLLLHDQM